MWFIQHIIHEHQMCGTIKEKGAWSCVNVVPMYVHKMHQVLLVGLLPIMWTQETGRDARNKVYNGIAGLNRS
jgi:hypothetical protein